MRAVHQLKCHPAPFQRARSGIKKHEIRKTDRDFQVGDILVLEEFDPGDDPRLTGKPRLTGERDAYVVTYISMPGTWGLPPDICVMSIEPFKGEG